MEHEPSISRISHCLPSLIHRRRSSSDMASCPPSAMSDLLLLPTSRKTSSSNLLRPLPCWILHGDYARRGGSRPAVSKSPRKPPARPCREASRWSTSRRGRQPGQGSGGHTTPGGGRDGRERMSARLDWTGSRRVGDRSSLAMTRYLV
jgi:hypothetical protein